jgi:hypothetical protein
MSGRRILSPLRVSAAVAAATLSLALAGTDGAQWNSVHQVAGAQWNSTATTDGAQWNGVQPDGAQWN